MDSTQRYDKLYREVDLLKCMKHPNIIQLFEVLESEKYMGIVMEYANGGELFDHILAKRYLKDSEAKTFFSHLISAVKFLHENKTVHRDLKLE